MQAIPEQPKTVYSHKRRQILREALMVHLLPVAINFTLLGLYVQRVSWTPPWPTTNVLNALQFAAKVHETLMIASLVTILLHHIRYRLLSPGQCGLPLGLITSPFRLLDVTFLWSREFLATLRNLRSLRTSEVITIVIHLFMFTLAAVMGPASAISMLPRMGEWELAKTITSAPFYRAHDGDPVYQVYIGAALSDIFPKTITASFSPEACDYNNLSLPQTNDCPRFGLTDILHGLYLPETAGPGSDLTLSQKRYPSEYNITVQAHNQEVPTRVISSFTYPFELSPDAPPAPKFEAIVDVTTSTDVILSMTEKMIQHYLVSWMYIMINDFEAVYYNFVSGGEWPARFTLYSGQLHSGEPPSLWKQPYVSSFCSEPGVGSTASDSITFTFRQHNSTPAYTVTLESRLLSAMLSDTGMAFINSSNLNITPSYRPSAALAFTSQSYTTLCLVKAYWIDFTLSGSQWEDHDLVMGDLTWDWEASESGHPICDGCRFRAENAWFSPNNATEIIHLDLEWLAVLDHGTGSDGVGNHGFFDKVRRACLGLSVLSDDDPDNAGNNPDLICIAAGLGAGIAEGLSKMPSHIGIHELATLEDWPSNALTLSPLTSSFWAGHLDFSGNWTNSTFTPSQIKTNSTRLDFVLTQKLHGYSFSGITIIVAFVVLFLYVTTVLVHISVMTLGTSWSSRAWKTLGEFYVLALQSPAPASILDNTGGGVKARTTWRARASVEELQDGNRVGIVIREPGQSAAEDGSTSKVRPDWKYS